MTDIPKGRRSPMEHERDEAMQELVSEGQKWERPSLMERLKSPAFWFCESSEGHPGDATGTIHEAISEIERLQSENRSWRRVAEINGESARSHIARWASAEALLNMALPHVEPEDDTLAHMMRMHLSRYEDTPQ